jgi:hypothetical protein
MRRVILAIRSSILGAAALAFFAVVSCSNDDDACDDTADCPEPKGGTGGTGGAQPPADIECGDDVCKALILVPGIDPVAPCCTDENACGLDSSVLAPYGAVFEETCQALDQPGEVDSECAESAPVMREELPAPITFKGCCRTDTGTCGYMLDKILGGLITLGLGCVDSTPFLEGGVAPSCTPGEDNGNGGNGG